MKYWLLQNDQVVGPFEPQALREVPGVTKDTLVCPQGRAGTAAGDWQKIGGVPELAALPGNGARPAQALPPLPPEPTTKDLLTLAARLQDKVDLLDKSVAHLREALDRELEEKGLHARELAENLASLRSGLTKAITDEHSVEESVERQERMIGDLRAQFATLQQEQHKAEERRLSLERQRAEIERQRADVDRRLAEAASAAAQAAADAPAAGPAAPVPEALELPALPPVRPAPAVAAAPAPAPISAELVERLRPPSPPPVVSPVKPKKAEEPRSAAPSAPEGVGRNWKYLFAALLGPFLVGLSSSSFAVAMPAVADGIGTDIPGIAWAYVAFPIAMASLSVLFGRIGSRSGHRKISLIGITMMNLGAIGCALSQNEVHMTAARCIEGIGAAMLMSNCRVVTTDALAAFRSSTQAQAWIAVAINGGAVVGYLTSGWIVDHFTWNHMFYELAGLGVIFTALDFSVLGRIKGHLVTSKDAEMTIDYLGALLVAVLISLLVVLLHGRMAYRVTVHQRHELFVVWGILFAAFLARETMARNPIIKLSLFKIRDFSWSVLALHASGLMRGMIMMFMPFYLYKILKIDFAYLGFCLLVTPLGMICFSNIGAYIADRRGRHLPMAAGFLFMIFAMAVGTTLTVDSPTYMAVLLMGLTGIGLGLLETPIFANIMESVPNEYRGLANGMIPTANQSGQTLGAAFATLLLFMDFKWVLGDHIMPPDSGTEAWIWGVLRGRMFVDPIVISFNAAALCGIVLCLIAFVAIAVMFSGKRKRAAARAQA